MSITDLPILLWLVLAYCTLSVVYAYKQHRQSNREYKAIMREIDKLEKLRKVIRKEQKALDVAKINQRKRGIKR